MCSGVGCGKMDCPTRRAINHCQREGEKWGERDGRAAERKEKKKKASEDRRETGSDGVRDETLGEELKRWTVGETNMETEVERRSMPTCGKNGHFYSQPCSLKDIFSYVKVDDTDTGQHTWGIKRCKFFFTRSYHHECIPH